jgi:hypothetical protein
VPFDGIGGDGVLSGTAEFFCRERGARRGEAPGGAEDDATDEQKLDPVTFYADGYAVACMDIKNLPHIGRDRDLPFSSHSCQSSRHSSYLLSLVCII